MTRDERMALYVAGGVSLVAVAAIAFVAFGRALADVASDYFAASVEKERPGFWQGLSNFTGSLTSAAMTAFGA